MSSPRNARHGQQVPRRLAPIDHVRALYEGAVKSMDPDRPCTIVHKKDLIDAVRRVSPTNRDRSPKIVLKKNNAGGRHGAVTELNGNAGKSEITNLEECINVHARRYNNLKAKCEKKQREVDLLMDQLGGLDKEIELSKMIDLTIAAEKQSAQEEKIRMDRDPINSPSQKKIESWDPSQDEAIHQNNVRVDTLRLRNEMERSVRMEQQKDVDIESDDDLLELRGSLKRKSARGVTNVSSSSDGVKSSSRNNSGEIDSKFDDDQSSQESKIGDTSKKRKKSKSKRKDKFSSKSKVGGVASKRGVGGGRKKSAVSLSGGSDGSSSAAKSGATTKKSRSGRRSVAKVKRGGRGANKR
eukprot:g3445.t1